MTAGFKPSVEGCHHVFADNWTIKCSNMKSGVFPCTPCHCENSTFTLIVAQCKNWALIAPMVDWRPVTQKSWEKEILVTVLTVLLCIVLLWTFRLLYCASNFQHCVTIHKSITSGKILDSTKMRIFQVLGRRDVLYKSQLQSFKPFKQVPCENRNRRDWFLWSSWFVLSEWIEHILV